MSIRVVCPQGHDLKIKEKYAGMMGVCPICGTPIKVPDHTGLFDEDSIMDVLEPQESGVSGLSLQISDIDAWSMTAEQRDAGKATKTCTMCRKSVPENAHVCPYCHNYVPPLQWQ